MPGKRRSNGQLARDRRKTADLYLQGWLQADIAVELGNSPATVSRDIKFLQSEWQQSALVDIDAAKAKELAKVDRLEREYWTAWGRSCRDAETVKQKGQPGPGPGKVQTDSVERTVKGQAGDPRFLAGIQWCIDRRCKILGVDAPQRLEHSGPDGGPIETKVANDYSPTEHARAITTFIQAVGSIVDSADDREDGAVGAAKRAPVDGDPLSGG